MGLRAIPFSPSQNYYLSGSEYLPKCSVLGSSRTGSSKLVLTISAKAKKDDAQEEEEEPKNKRKQSLFSSVTEALDFSQVRSAKDAELLDEAREKTQSGERMSKEQVNSYFYNALYSY